MKTKEDERSRSKLRCKQHRQSQRFERQVEEELLQTLVEASNARGTRNIFDLCVDERHDILERTTRVSRRTDLPLA
jgi:hypothetical protein